MKTRSSMLLLALGISMATASSLAEATPPPRLPACDGLFHVYSTVDPSPTYNDLSGVDGTTASNVWAVGVEREGATDRTLTEHWDGSNWTVVSSPNVGSANNALNDVVVIRSTDAWAVGSSGNGAKALILHWNGSAWSKITAPSPGSGANQLLGVSAVSVNDIWAVGEYANSTGPQKSLVLHWDGHRWRHVSSPSPSTVATYLEGVDARAADDAWAVGTVMKSAPGTRTFVIHWNGTRWRVAHSANKSTYNNQLSGVVAVSPGGVLAAGAWNDGSNFQILIERWNGHKFVATSTPTVGDSSSLSDIEVSGTGELMAVGSDTASGSGYPLVMQKVGGAWTSVGADGPGSSSGFQDLAMFGGDRQWAVGETGASTPITTLGEQRC